MLENLCKMVLQYLAVVTLAFICVSAQLESPVKVSVYYESRCPDSVFFVLNQLKPTFEALGSSKMAVDFVPYGKADHTAQGNGFTFNNQHGRPEYQDNKMHACVISTLASTQPETTVSFIACALSRPEDAANTDRACFNSIGPADKSAIRRCNEGVLGDQLLASYGDRTHALSPKISLSPNMGHIPRIEINGVYNQMEERMANENLKSLICSKFHQYQPQQQEECMRPCNSCQGLQKFLSSLPSTPRTSLEPNYPQLSPSYAQSSVVYPSLPTTSYSAYPGYPSYQTPTNQEYQPQSTANIYPGYPTQNLYTYPGYLTQTHTSYPSYLQQTSRQYSGYPAQTYTQYPGYPSQTYTQNSGYPSRSQTYAQTYSQYPAYPAQTQTYTQSYPQYPSYSTQSS